MFHLHALPAAGVVFRGIMRYFCCTVNEKERKKKKKNKETKRKKVGKNII